MWLMIKAYSKMIWAGIIFVLFTLLMFYKSKAERKENELLKRQTANMKAQNDAVKKASDSLQKAQEENRERIKKEMARPDDDRDYFS